MATRKELDEMILGGCCVCEGENGIQDTLYLHAACHPGAALEASYTLGGTLLVACSICAKAVVSVEVAE